jgi:hypothetical protein
MWTGSIAPYITWTAFPPLPVVLAHLRGLACLLFIERICAVSSSIGWQLNDDPIPRLLPDSRVPWKEADV